MSLQYSKSCSLMNNNGNFYIFEIILTTEDNKKKILRKIKTLKNDNLLNFFDKVKLTFNKINLTMIDFNDPNNIIVIKKNINNFKKIFIINKKKLILSLDFTNEYLSCDYQIN